MDSTPLSAQCEKPLLLLVAGVWLALRRAREGWDRLRLVPAALPAYARLADLHDLAAQVGRLEDVVEREHMRADAVALETLEPLQPTQSS